MIDWSPKAPGAVVDYSIGFTSLLQEGETLASHSVTAENVTVDSSAIDGTDVRVWLSGGSEGTTGRVFAQVTTNSSPARTFTVTAVVPIGTLAVGLGKAKEYLRVDFDTDDTLITTLLRSAIAQVEHLTGHILAPRVVERTLRQFPSSELVLPFEPVSEIVSVTHVDSTGATVTLAEDDFRTIDGDPFMLVPPIGGSWPAALDEPRSVRVRALAGYEAGLLPPDLEQAVLMLVAHGYENREAVSVRIGSSLGGAVEVPLGVRDLCWPYRRLMIG